MRILLINQAFYPDSAATAQHGWDLARRLRDAGHEVTAIASRSHYGESGATLPGRETVDGVRIIRVGRSFFGKRSLAGRLFDFASFHALAAWAALTLPRHDVSICFTTPPFIAWTGIVLRWIKGTRCVNWMMDVYPDVMVSVGMMDARTVRHRILDRLGRWIMRHSDAVVVLGRCMRERVLAKGIDADRVSVIPPWAPEEAHGASAPSADNPYRQRWKSGATTLFMYSGNFGLGHDFATIERAIRELCREPGSQFALVGGGKRKSSLVGALAGQVASGQVIDEPYQEREQLQDLLGAADVHLVSLAAGCEGTMVPSKFYGILAAGRTVIYVGTASGEVARVVTETGCGDVTVPGDVDALVQAMRRMRDDPQLRLSHGKHAEAASRGPYARERALELWTDLLGRVMAR
jgi:colanic acid biosynthesis glycosyl transferase WcaI